MPALPPRRIIPAGPLSRIPEPGPSASPEGLWGRLWGGSPGAEHPGPDALRYNRPRCPRAPNGDSTNVRLLLPLAIPLHGVTLAAGQPAAQPPGCAPSGPGAPDRPALQGPGPEVLRRMGEMRSRAQAIDE